ncbi:MAG: hypothetical protein KGZ40_02085 [Clostridiales bacterium]|nr:hypothetical protein [Clostridiales bacterium]
MDDTGQRDVAANTSQDVNSALGDSRVPHDEETSDAYTVMEIFGIELKVRSPRLAEVLTMEASHALGTDVRELADPAALRRVREDLAEALPDVMIAPESPHDHDVTRARTELRARADALARAMGFETAPGGVWLSPTGISLVTRIVERVPTVASATDAIDKIAGLLETADSESSALLVVESQEAADVFKVAIRHRRLYDVMRTISVGNLQELRTLVAGGAIDHARALVLLSPLVGIDVGEVLSILSASANRESGDSTA